MAVIMLTVPCIGLLAAIANSEIVRYDGHKVISVQPHNRDQLEWLGRLHDESMLDFWTHPSLIRPTDIRVTPDEFKELSAQLAANGFNVTIIHEDVQKLIESMGQHPHSRDKRQVKISATTVIGGFPRYDNIYTWLTEKASTNANIMKIYSLEKAYEGRTQYIVTLGLPGTNKPIIWLDSGIHAREWLSVSTTLNIINTILNGYELKDSVITSLLTSFDWYILPVANPDGYEYSHSNGGRRWRKTRTRYTSGIGADPNRNRGYYWGTTGISKVPSSDKYCGPYQSSEKCVANMKNALQGFRSRLAVFMSLHSYGQMWFVPYAYSSSAFPSDYTQLKSMGSLAVSAMRRSTGATYRVGRVPDRLRYEASGSSMDWVKGYLGTQYAFGMALRPAQGTSSGFIAPVSSIAPTAQEVWVGMKTIAQQVQKISQAG